MSNNDVFDVRRIRRLVELMHENNLSEIDLQQGDLRMQLRRSSPAIAMQPVAVAAPVPVAAAPAPMAAAPAAPAAEPVADESHLVVIKSPMVGTFYSAPNPKSPAYIKVGDIVHPDKTVCIIEAMKVYNEIAAELSGKVVAVLVANGETVEFGKPLFKVDPKGA